MQDLNHQLKQLCHRNRDGSFATQADRERLLTLCANDLAARGFQHLHADSLKPKHVAALLNKWKQDGVSTGTIKNRMSALRWWAEKVGKDNVIARSNAAYGIAERMFVTNVSKAKVLDADMLARVTDPYTRMSLQLQAAFGLRREESIKIKPGWADCGSFLRLQDSWTKGGKYREVPITTAQQRAVLDAAQALAGKGSLIPAQMQYRDQLNRFRAQCDKAGIHGVHGLRHEYAQRRYAELTSWQCPANGGSTSKQLAAADKQADQDARLTLSKEMGHFREQVTSIYLGR
ncbi:integrase [Duganella sp. FT92W]|uniref:Integrase n=1 Tax=Pseudoduganella rivuli TaxID=2666085 RepID=A0A7X2ITA6_9BURK|nr:phage integrase N-terminal domain-containing protein [Pseudoduganella rivuli]MRV75716.1 integrase [Pseudoduganella rivuli]